MLCSDDKTTSYFVRTESRWINIYLLSRLWISILLFFTIIFPNTAQATDHSKMINCDIHHGACALKLSDTDISLDISPKPVKAMTDLTFTVTLTGNQDVSAPYIDLSMPGMKMGPNRVLLKSIRKGVYTGTGTIVRCPSGKRIWKATVTVPDKGAVEFIFDVIY
jgi:hypothetical protein